MVFAISGSKQEDMLASRLTPFFPSAHSTWAQRAVPGTRSSAMVTRCSSASRPLHQPVIFILVMPSVRLMRKVWQQPSSSVVIGGGAGAIGLRPSLDAA